MGLATIKTVLQVQDRMTAPLRNITAAVNTLTNTMERMQGASGRAVDTNALQAARGYIAQATVEFDRMEREIADAAREEERFNDSLRDSERSANALGGALKGVLATVVSIAGVKSALGWVDGNLKLSDIQRNAENQLKAVLANMGAQSVTIQAEMDGAQTLSAFDAIAAKASAIQGKGIYGDEAMIAGAAELATYFQDTEAILSMMDTLSDYTMGMTGGGAVDSTAMTNYATNLGKIMSGSYDAMTKKGFAFSDAQKAIIEGTATEAQIVAELGEEYLSASAEMQAAAAINSIIAESWDGLYETMSNTPEGKIIQFQNRFGDLRETLGDRLYPAVVRFFDTMNERFPQIERVMNGFANGCTLLITLLTWIASLALGAADTVVRNWDLIAPVVAGAAAALAVYNAHLATGRILAIGAAAAKLGHAAASVAETVAIFALIAAQEGLNAALAACPLTWILIAVIALVALFYAAVAAVNHFAGTSASATGMICGVFAAAGAFIGNLFLALANLVIGVFVTLWNFIAAFANFFGNVLDDPIGAILRLIFDMADTVLSVLETLASAIDTVFGSNLAGAVSGWRDSLGGWVKDTFGEGETIMEKINPGDIQLGRFEYGAAYDAGWNFGSGLEEKAKGLFDFGKFGFDPSSVENALDGIAADSGETAANTGAMKDSLDISGENLKLIRDIAEREAINRFTTAEIHIEQHNENHIGSDMDVDGIADKWCRTFAEQLNVQAEGVHE